MGDYLPVIADHLDWKIDPPGFSIENSPLVEFDEVFARDFGYVNPHMNFVGTVNGEALYIFSVQKNPTREYPKTSYLINLGPSYKALLMDSEGYEEFYIHNVPLQRGGTDPMPIFEHFLLNRIMRKDFSLYAVTLKSFVHDLIKLETKFSRKVKAMKIAVLYIKPGQTDVKGQIFPNQPPEDSRFFDFMEKIADRINMTSWKGYRGDMGTCDAERDSFYTEWKGIKVMFHVAPYLNTEQHRRLVGNDIAVIIFYDNPNPKTQNFEIFGSTDLGIVPHVFSVVEPHPTDKNRYRMGFFRRPTVPSFAPISPPKNQYLKITKKPNFNNLKDFLLTKIHNGLVAAQSVSPLNRLYTVPRREAIKDLGAKYPPIKFELPIPGPIGGAIGGAAGAIGNTIIGTTLGSTITGVLAAHNSEEKPIYGSKLKVKLLKARDLAPKDSNGFSDPYVRIIVGGKEQKSQVIRKTLNPIWDEEFEFEYNDDDDLEEIHFICMDWDKVGGHDFMGEFHKYLKTLPFNYPVWFPLLTTTTDLVTGEILFELTKFGMEPEERKKEDKKASRLSLKSPLSIINIGEAPRVFKGKRSPRSTNEHNVAPKIVNDIKKDKVYDSPIKAASIGGTFTGNLGRALSKLPRAHSEKVNELIQRVKRSHDDDEIYDDKPEPTPILFKTASTKYINRDLFKQHISHRSNSSSNDSSPLIARRPNRPEDAAPSLPPASVDRTKIGNRPVSPRNTHSNEIKRRNSPSPSRSEINHLELLEASLKTNTSTRGPIDIARVNLSSEDLSLMDYDTSASELDYLDYDDIVGEIFTEGKENDQIRKSNSETQSSSSSTSSNNPDITMALNDVKNSVEELICETIQIDVNRESALRVASTMRVNLQRVITLMEAGEFDGPLKENTVQMINYAKELLKNCLEYVRLKLSGQDASHVLPSLKQNSEEFTNHVMIATQLHQQGKQ